MLVTREIFEIIYLELLLSWGRYLIIKPTSKLSTLDDKSSAFFSNPYPHPDVSLNQASSAQSEAGELFCAGNDDSKSQLRLSSPKLLEGGFSFVASDYGASRTTFKVACRQGLVPGSIVRRVLLVLIIATVGGLLLRLPAIFE
ncbi:hypothetical protein L204_100963 [Cryptococcus depauperatus]